jgi:hypothetical protein
MISGGTATCWFETGRKTLKESRSNTLSGNKVRVLSGWSVLLHTFTFFHGTAGTLTQLRGTEGFWVQPIVLAYVTYLWLISLGFQGLTFWSCWAACRSHLHAICHLKLSGQVAKWWLSTSRFVSLPPLVQVGWPSKRHHEWSTVSCIIKSFFQAIAIVKSDVIVFSMSLGINVGISVRFRAFFALVLIWAVWWTFLNYMHETLGNSHMCVSDFSWTLGLVVQCIIVDHGLCRQQMQQAWD